MSTYRVDSLTNPNWPTHSKEVMPIQNSSFLLLLLVEMSTYRVDSLTNPNWPTHSEL